MGISSGKIANNIFTRDKELYELSKDPGLIEAKLIKVAKKNSTNPNEIQIFSDQNISRTVQDILEKEYYNQGFKKDENLINVIRYLFKNNVDKTIEFLLNFQDSDNYLQTHQLNEVNKVYKDKKATWEISNKEIKERVDLIEKELAKLPLQIKNKKQMYDNAYLVITYVAGNAKLSGNFQIKINTYVDVNDAKPTNYIDLSESNIVDKLMFKKENLLKDTTYLVSGFNNINLYFQTISTNRSVPHSILVDAKLYTSISGMINKLYEKEAENKKLYNDVKTYFNNTLEKILDLNVPNIYRSFNKIVSNYNVQFIYLETLYVKAILQQIKFLKIKRNNTPPDSPEFVTAEDNVGIRNKYIYDHRKEVIENLRAFVKSKNYMDINIRNNNEKNKNLLIQTIINTSKLRSLSQNIDKMQKTMDESFRSTPSAKPSAAPLVKQSAANNSIPRTTVN